MTDPYIGRRVGNYTMTSKLGEGGMGVVYVAQHDTLDTKVVIKLLHARLTGTHEIVSRFVAEAQAASSIKHPNIVSVLDAGYLDSGEHYIMLEHLAGYPLERARVPMELWEVVSIMTQVCAGLEAAHARGIIHRDLKPDNLFLLDPPATAPAGTAQVVKILDFGIAKLMGDTEHGGVHTRTGLVMGTPSYMSIEQASGSSKVTVRSDIYSLGVICYRLITGQLPYVAEGNPAALVLNMMGTTPTPAKVHRADLPDAWNDIIMAAIAVDAMARPSSARELAERLIAATPGGNDVARAVGYVPQGVPPHALTRPTGGTHTQLPRVVAAAAISTLSGSAGQSTARERPSVRRRPRRWPLAAAVVGLLGVVGIVVGVVVSSSSSSSGAAADADVAATGNETTTVGVTLSIDAAPVVGIVDASALVMLRIETVPSGATVFVGDEDHGKSPAELQAQPGQTLAVRAELRGYVIATDAVTVQDTAHTVSLELTKKRRHRPTTKPPVDTSKPPPTRIDPNAIGE